MAFGFFWLSSASFGLVSSIFGYPSFGKTLCTVALPLPLCHQHGLPYTLPFSAYHFRYLLFVTHLFWAHCSWCTAFGALLWHTALGAPLLVHCSWSAALAHRSWCTALGAPLLARHFLAQFSPVDCTLFQAFLQFTTITIKRSFLTHFLRHMHFFCVRSYPLLYPPPRIFCQFRTNFPASFGWGLKKLPQIPTPKSPASADKSTPKGWVHSILPEVPTLFSANICLDSVLL